MSQLDDLLGGILGGSGGGGGFGSVLGQLAGSRTGATADGGGAGGGGLVAALLPMLGGLLASGGLSKILSGFKAQGLGSKSDSWVSTGSNEPVSAGEVEQAIGAEEIDEIALRLGVPRDEAAQAIAEVLPQLVDRVTPAGELPPESELDDVFGRLAQFAHAQ